MWSHTWELFTLECDCEYNSAVKVATVDRTTEESLHPFGATRAEVKFGGHMCSHIFRLGCIIYHLKWSPFEMRKMLLVTALAQQTCLVAFAIHVYQAESFGILSDSPEEDACLALAIECKPFCTIRDIVMI